MSLGIFFAVGAILAVLFVVAVGIVVFANKSDSQRISGQPSLQDPGQWAQLGQPGWNHPSAQPPAPHAQPAPQTPPHQGQQP